jgi:GT2 family glycosyltransferase
MPKVAYIIPLHKKDEKVFRAIASIPDGAIIVVSIPEKLEDWFGKNVPEVSNVKTVVTKGKGHSYPKLVNAGLNYANMGEYDLISILEYDDTVLPNAHKIVDDYYGDWEETEIFAPLVCIVKETEDEDKPVLVGIGNEASMAPGVAEEFGTFDFNMMLRTNFVFLNNCYIKPSVFEDYGVLKENFELFYDYEWILRVVYNGGIIRSIPKATHFHGLNDEGAFEAQKAMPKEVRENWLGAARREYFFEDDRDISFE